MTLTEIILLFYILLGIILFLFNKKISDFLYKLILFYTNKLKLKDLFIFKIDHNNKDSMRFLTRSFTIMFGLFLLAISLYNFFK